MPPISSNKRPKSEKDLSPLKWTAFFDRVQSIVINETDRFNVYVKGSAGLVFVLLHGGGYSGLTWACLTEELSEHVECQIIAPDLRGHGSSRHADETDLSLDQQVRDIQSIIDHFRAEIGDRRLVVIGHSMGGSLAVHSAVHMPNLSALCVIDVVEGSALEALNAMHIFLRNRPQMFKSEEHAIEWCLKSGTVRNERSARVSMPAQLKAMNSDVVPDHSSTISTKQFTQQQPPIIEENEEQDQPSNSNINTNTDQSITTNKSISEIESTALTWRIDLIESQPHWKGWFQGLSDAFLSVPVPKLLLLAGVDRMDKALSIAHMQGKFQNLILPKVGHALQEDSPDKVAESLANFVVRNRLAVAKKEIDLIRPTCH